MELIITEKENAARRIAEILSEGSAQAERKNGVNVYRWGSKRVMGLSGHVVGVDFPPEYSDWRDVEPAELVDADVVKSATQENIVETLRFLARKAEEATIATDYDREGELIGKEAYELIRDETDVPVKRVRFSSITEREVRNAFANPDDIDFDLAAAGEARQIIDLVWGAALTRFLSLSARQLGNDFISVGRVQSPTLKLIVDREREIDAFDPEDYWEIFGDLTKGDESFEAQYFYEADDGTEAERVWDEESAEDAYEAIAGVDSATVTSVRRRTRTDDPPDPFNTTAFISAASSLGYSAQRSMSIAEDLYTAGYMTYPRTDNTVYPDDLEPDELLDEFVEYAPPPQAHEATTRTVEPEESKFSGFVFKIQANMDPQHRDRIAFLRVCSGRFAKGMKVDNVRAGKDTKIAQALTFMAAERGQTEEAYPGDVIGVPNHGTIRIGDTFTEGEKDRFTGIPNFAPELFRRIQLRDPMKAKQLQKGLIQLSEEGAVQVFRPVKNNDMIVGAVGTLQFDVVVARLKNEYGVDAVYEPINVATARWVTCDDPKALEQFERKNQDHLALDGSDNLTYIAPTMVNLQLAEERYPEVTFHKTKER